MRATRDAKKVVRLARAVARKRQAVREYKRGRAERGTLSPDTYEIGVYFADSEVNMYQMRQWYAPLRELTKKWRVLIIARDPLGAAMLQRESGLEVAWAPQVSHLEKLVASQPLHIIMYVNQNTRNFQMLRYGNRWHVFINHGESDKMYMTTNQFKAYDFAFVAGEAAKQRLSLNLWNYDVASRTFEIGRPQTDHLTGEPPYPDDDRTVVLYAPTWEGDRPAAQYSSVASHGEVITQQVLASPKHRLVYRPHPRTGILSGEVQLAHDRIVAAIEEANEDDPTAHHIFDTDPSISWQLADSDVAICDISAMVYDRLAVGRPVLVTRPVSPTALVDEVGYLGECEWLTAENAPNILTEIARLIEDPEAKKQLSFWATRYFGSVANGEPTKRFHRAIEELMLRWHQQPQRGDHAGATPQHTRRLSGRQ